MEWTLKEFFAGDGVSTFIQRLSAVLGIHISRVKVVSAYEGSLNVGVIINDDPANQVANDDGTLQPNLSTVTEM